MKCPQITVVGLLSLSLSVCAQLSDCVSGSHTERAPDGFIWQGLAQYPGVNLPIKQNDGTLRAYYQYKGYKGSELSFAFQSPSEGEVIELWFGNSDGTKWNQYVASFKGCQIQLPSFTIGLFYGSAPSITAAVTNAAR